MMRNTGLDLIMRLRVCWLILLCCTCGIAIAEVEAVDGAGQASVLVSQYLKSRDALLHKFSKEPMDTPVSDKEWEKDWAAQVQGLKMLEAQLRAIIGPVHIAGFKSDGKISLTSLRETPYGDASRLDGLIYSGKDGQLFVTTRDMASRWLKHWKIGKNSSMHDLQHHESVFFALETAVMKFMTLPIKASNHVYIRTSLALLGQDSGPYPPGVVYIYMEKGDDVLLLEHALAVDIPQISACEREYNVAMEKGGRASHPWNPDPAFLSYKRCFADKADSLPFYKPMLKNIQSIVDHIMSNGAPDRKIWRPL